MAQTFADFTIEAAGDAIFWVDVHGQFRRVNAAACLLHGYTRDELLGLNVFDLTHEYTSDRWEEFWREIKKKKTIVMDSRHIRKDGIRFPVEATVSFIAYEGDDFCCCFLRDISRRKEAEAEVVNLSRFPDENPHPVLRIAQDGTAIYSNHSGIALLSHMGVDAVGKEVGGEWRQMVRKALSHNAPLDAEAELNGRVLLLSFVGIPKAGYVNVYALDITERKQAERSLADALAQVQTLKNRL